MIRAGKKSSNLEKTLIFLSSRKLVGGIGSIILFVHSGLYFLNKSNDESLYSTFQSSTEFSFFLENSSRLSPLSLFFRRIVFWYLHRVANIILAKQRLVMLWAWFKAELPFLPFEIFARRQCEKSVAVKGTFVDIFRFEERREGE